MLETPWSTHVNESHTRTVADPISMALGGPTMARLMPDGKNNAGTNHRHHVVTLYKTLLDSSTASVSTVTPPRATGQIDLS